MSMRCLHFTLLLFLVNTPSAFKGFEVDSYYPLCAHGCLRAFSAVLQPCSTPDDPITGMMVINTATRPACYAGSEPYLTSLAFCVKEECTSSNLSILQLEKFWAAYTTGDPKVPTKWSYMESLMRVTKPPTEYLSNNQTTVLNYTMLANHSVMMLQKSTLYSVEYESVLEGQYGVAILVAFFGLPVIITLIGYLPFMTTLSEKIKPYLIWPSILGTYHVRPLPFKLGNAPTMGQSLYIGAFVIVNIVMTATDYRVAIPHAWYGNDKYYAVMAYVMWRTGAFALIFLPLVILFSTRNNVLLWLSNWSHSTYMLLHRWLARVFAIHVILHSVLAVPLYIHTGSYKSEYKQPWWIWGVVATLTTTIMLVGSGLYVRNWSYEVFLITHIILAALTIIGTWYHIWFCFQWLGNYQQLIYASIGVWVFDRFIRVMRVLKNGFRRARVTEIGPGYVRIDVPGVRWVFTPGQNAYAHFPTLSKFRVWENHPFSVMPTSFLKSYEPYANTLPTTKRGTLSSADDIENKISLSTAYHTTVDGAPSGVTLFIRKASGMTRKLAANDSLLILLDGPYPNNPTASIMRTDRLLIITGGIGVSGVLPWVFAHPNVKFTWSVKKSAECLVDSLNTVLTGVDDKDIRVGSRLDIQALLNQEVEAGWKKVGVVACGPGGLCDDVRAAVCVAAKGSTRFELEVDAYSW